MELMTEPAELRSWRVVRFVVVSGMCILCAGLLVHFRRKLSPLIPRLPNVNLLILSLANEILVTIPSIAKAPPGVSEEKEDWWMGLVLCRVYTWNVLYLGQTLGVTLVAISLHEWVQKHHKLRNSTLGRTFHLVLAFGPWIVSILFSMRLVVFTHKVGVVLQLTNNTHECQIDFHSLTQIFNLRTTNIFFEFLGPTFLSSCALYSLWKIEGHDIANNAKLASKRLRGGPGITNHCEYWIQSRRLPVVFLNLIFFIMRGPYNMLMLLFVCQPMSVMSPDALQAWHTVSRLDRATYSLLPVLWVLLQPEVPRALCRCACAVRRRLLGPAVGECVEENDEVLWTLTDTTTLENTGADVTVTSLDNPDVIVTT